MMASTSVGLIENFLKHGLEVFASEKSNAEEIEESLSKIFEEHVQSISKFPNPADRIISYGQTIYHHGDLSRKELKKLRFKLALNCEEIAQDVKKPEEEVMWLIRGAKELCVTLLNPRTCRMTKHVQKAFPKCIELWRRAGEQLLLHQDFSKEYCDQLTDLLRLRVCYSVDAAAHCFEQAALILLKQTRCVDISQKQEYKELSQGFYDRANRCYIAYNLAKEDLSEYIELSSEEIDFAQKVINLDQIHQASIYERMILQVRWSLLQESMFSVTSQSREHSKLMENATAILMDCWKEVKQNGSYFKSSNYGDEFGKFEESYLEDEQKAVVEHERDLISEHDLTFQELKKVISKMRSLHKIVTVWTLKDLKAKVELFSKFEGILSRLIKVKSNLDNIEEEFKRVAKSLADRVAKTKMRLKEINENISSFFPYIKAEFLYFSHYGLTGNVETELEGRRLLIHIREHIKDLDLQYNSVTYRGFSQKSRYAEILPVRDLSPELTIGYINGVCVNRNACKIHIRAEISKNWKDVRFMHDPSSDQFYLNSFVETLEEAKELYKYMKGNFSYIGEFAMDISVRQNNYSSPPKEFYDAIDNPELLKSSLNKIASESPTPSVSDADIASSSGNDALENEEVAHGGG